MAAAFAVAALALAGAPSASAHTPSSPAAQAGNRPNDIPCYTSFDPGDPEGGSMVQYYNNCSPETATVCAYDIEDNYRHSDGPKTAVHGQIVKWYWSTTTPGHHYTTRFC
ncbi:hypothetical protein [Streptomyces sp. HUAS TT7]|uniref:hypothetical protein n=1 Tax=Streptomyces sp. HUAS TT7 TaxID=3447507 RepID=UPI003F65BC7F